MRWQLVARLAWGVVAPGIVLALLNAPVGSAAPAAFGAAAQLRAEPAQTRPHHRPSVAVFPIPGSRVATPQTQITFRGVPADRLGTIAVAGSRSGVHIGRIEADSDGHGASFMPRRSFAPGETVTVRTHLNLIGGRAGSYRFTIEHPGGVILPPGGHRLTPPRVPGDVDRFYSRPDLHPAAVRVTQHSAHASTGDIFLTPMRGPVQWGPEIVAPSGRLVWFQPVGRRQTATDLEVQRYHGQPVLTWFRGFVNAGDGQGFDLIMNRHYQRIAAVHAGNGLRADLHEFQITPQGTALIDSYHLVRWGSLQVPVQDCVIQEIDIKTGLVLFQWDSLDHIPLTDSYATVQSGHHPFDYFHINSVQEAPDGNLIVSARNTSAVYDIDHRTGAVIWRLGGRRSTFAMGPGTSTVYQHDARIHPGGLLTLFDDGDAPAQHPQSRAILERLAPGRVTLVHAYDHSPAIDTDVEGSVQLLANGDVFVGWGSEPFFSEYTAGGQQLFDGHFVSDNSSYRSFRFPWSAQPATRPAIALTAGGRGAATVHASWNGATDVARWRVLGGARRDALSPIASVARTGFETSIAIHGRDRYFAVLAIGRTGSVLSTSRTRERR